MKILKPIYIPLICRALWMVSLLIASLAPTGCANSHDSRGSGYQTIGHDPRRDTDLARKENASALDRMDQGDWSGAETALKRSLDADVTFGPAHNNLGKVYFHQQNLYLAAWEFQYASKLLPYQPEPRNNLGLVFEAAGKLDDAVSWYDAAIKMEPENPQFVGNEARALIRRGDHDARTRELLEKVVMIDTRPSWNQWARERLALLGSAPDRAGPASQPVEGSSSLDER